MRGTDQAKINREFLALTKRIAAEIGLSGPHRFDAHIIVGVDDAPTAIVAYSKIKED